MSSKLTRAAYRQLIGEDIAWLEAQPRTLERDHIIAIVRESERYYYDSAQAEAVGAVHTRALRPLDERERARVLASEEPMLDAVDAVLEARKAHP